MKTTRWKAGGRGGQAGYYRALLDEQASSELSMTAFARGVGLSAATLYSWRRRLAAASEATQAEDFLEVKVTPDTTIGRSGVPIVLTVDGRLRIELEPDFDDGTLERLLRLLSRC